MLLAESSNDPEGTRARLEEWLARDERAARIFQDLTREVEKHAGAAARLRYDPLLRPTRPMPHEKRSPWTHFSKTPLLVLASVLLLAGFVGLLLVTLGPLQYGEMPSAHASTGSVDLTTEPGSRRSFRTSDGSALTLDGDTRLVLTYDDRFRRVSLLRGRARFSVAHEPSRPFSVTALGGTTTAIGTLFDVWIRQPAEVRVVLLRGRIQVERPATRANATTMLRTLTAGQHLLYSISTAGAAQGVPTRAANYEIAWMHDTLDFDDVPLREVILEANRHSRLQIALGSDDLGDIEIFGTFQIHDPEKLAHRLATAFDLTLTRVGDQLILSRRR